MTSQITTGAVHHVTLTVTDVGRAHEFYTSVLGFQKAADYGSRVVLSNGSVLLILGPAQDPERTPESDSFNENRVGLDHLSLAVESREELTQAVKILDERSVPHGEIVDLAEFGIYVLMTRDPDNIQVELTAPHS